jgi:hypothetical protein
MFLCVEDLKAHVLAVTAEHQTFETDALSGSTELSRCQGGTRLEICHAALIYWPIITGQFC